MIRLIAAVDARFGIAKHGRLPWELPAEQLYFRNMTMRHGGVVLMGRKTYQCIGHALADRRNYVASRTLPDTSGITVVEDVRHFLVNCPDDVWVIGGAAIYAQALPYADELYITRIQADFNCDQFFPIISEQSFQLVFRSPPQFEAGVSYLYEIYNTRK